MKRVNLLSTLIVLIILAGCTTDPKKQALRYIVNGNKYYQNAKYKEASLMYRRALQKDPKNPEAWYKLGLVNYNNGAVGEARGDFIRVSDLADESKKYDATAEDAIARIADLDYFGYIRLPTDKFKYLKEDLDGRYKQLAAHYPGGYHTFRVQGLDVFANIPTERDNAKKVQYAKEALGDFRKADRLKPYETGIGVPIFSVLALLGQTADAEKYADEMIRRKTADSRIYDSLWRYYLQSGQIPKAEDVRKKEVANNPKDGAALSKLAFHYYVTKRQPELQATVNRLTSDLKTYPNAYMLIGDLYYANGDLADAISNYRQGVKVDEPNKALYLKKVAEALALGNKNDEALKVVNELLKNYPNDPEAIAMNVSLQISQGKPADADKFINTLQPLIAKTSPNDRERATILHFNLGRAYALKGDPQSRDQARLQFQEAINSQTKPYVPAYMALAQLELERGENPQAADHAGEVLKVAPLNVTARLVRTMALANMGQADQARQELTQVLKMRPDSHDARFQLARLDLIQKKFKDAEAEFEALKKENDPRGMAGLVECKVQEGQAPEAIQILQAELVKSPTNPLYRSALAGLYATAGKFAESAAQYRQVLDQNPNADPRAREEWSLRMGESLRRGGDPGGALAAFEKAGQIAPRDTTPVLETAMLLQMTGKFDQARQRYEQVLKLQPDNAIALNNVAYAKADEGTDLDNALTYAQRAQKNAPQDPNIQDTVGLIYFKKDAVDSSVQIFTELVKRVPDNPTYHLHLAMALYKKGDKTQARQQLDLARRHGPSDQEQAQIKALISKMG